MNNPTNGLIKKSGGRFPSFRGLGEGLEGFWPQIRLQRAEISPGTNSEVISLESKVFGDPRLGTDTSGPGEAVFAIRFNGKPEI